MEVIVSRDGRDDVAVTIPVDCTVGDAKAAIHEQLGLTAGWEYNFSVDGEPFEADGMPFAAHGDAGVVEVRTHYKHIARELLLAKHDVRVMDGVEEYTQHDDGRDIYLSDSDDLGSSHGDGGNEQQDGIPDTPRRNSARVQVLLRRAFNTQDVECLRLILASKAYKDEVVLGWFLEDYTNDASPRDAAEPARDADADTDDSGAEASISFGDDSDGFSPIARIPYAKRTALLISAGVDPNIRWHDGTTLLSFLILSANVPTVLQLIGVDGCDVNLCNEPNGMSPLMMAVADGHTEVVRALLARGADVAAVNMLSRSGATQRTAMGYAIQRAARVPDEMAAIIELLREHDAPVVAFGEAGTPTPTLLVEAVGARRPSICRVLLAQGADPNAAAPDGKTPLQTAVKGGHPDCVRVLLEHGATADAMCLDGVKDDVRAVLEQYQGASPP